MEPLGALLALGIVLLICRWVFAPPPASRAPRPAPPPGDYGLLEPVATCGTWQDAVRLRDMLRDGGVRGTVAEGTEPGQLVVLVFRADVGRARALVDGETSSSG